MSALGSGCGIIKFPSAEASAGSFEGDECDEVRQSAEVARNTNGSGSITKAETSRQKVLVATCPPIDYTKMESGRAVAAIRYQTRTLPNAEEIHAAFDLRHPDPIDAATLVISTETGGSDERARMGASRNGVGRHNANQRGGSGAGAVDKPFGDARAEKSETALGMAAVYATLVDDAALDRALEATKLPPAARAMYKSVAAEDSRSAIAAVNAMKPGVRRVVYDIPFAIATDLRAQFAAKKQLGDMLDGLAAQADTARAGQGDAAVVARDLVALRTNVLNACGGTETCTYDPLYVEATHELATLYVTAKMAKEARAESELLSRNDSLRKTFQAATYTAQTDAGAKSTRALQTKNAADKMDAKLAKVMDTEDAVSFSYADFYRADLSMPFLASVLTDSNGQGSGQGHPTSGYVQSVTPKGDKAVVEYRTEYVTDDVSYNCQPTGRIDRINLGGKIEYEERCQYRSERRALEKPAPVTVSLKEAASVKPGELLAVWVTGNEGSVYTSRAGKQGGSNSSSGAILQIRGDRLRAEPASKDTASKETASK